MKLRTLKCSGPDSVPAVAERPGKRICLSALKCLRHEIEFNGWRILRRTINDFSLWRLIEYPKITEYLDLRPGDVVLDIGSGTSTYPLMLMREGVNVVILELSEGRTSWQQAQYLKHHRPGSRDGWICSVCGDASRMPFATGSFGKVSAISSIEHIPDDVAVGQEVGRVLVDGGVGAVSVPYTRRVRRHFFRGVKSFVQVRRNEFIQANRGGLTRFYTLEDIESRFAKPAGPVKARHFFGRRILNGCYHETWLNRYWRTFVLKDLLLAAVVHPLEEKFLKRSEPFDVIFKVVKQGDSVSAD